MLYMYAIDERSPDRRLLGAGRALGGHMRSFCLIYLVDFDLQPKMLPCLSIMHERTYITTSPSYSFGLCQVLHQLIYCGLHLDAYFSHPI
jgi:hypothetical protein